MLKRVGYVLGIVVFVSLAAVSSGAAAVVGAVGLFVVLPGLALVDASNVPMDSWNAAGRSRTAWTISFFIIPLGIGLVAMVVYWTWLRRRLPGGALRPGERVEITAGLYAGQQATLSSRFMFGLGGLWKATVANGDGSTAEVQVSSSSVRRRRGVGAQEAATVGAEPSSQLTPRPRGSIRLRLAGVGLVVVLCGVVLTGIGVDSGEAVGILLGVAVTALGLVQTASVLTRFSNRRRLPGPLRAVSSSPGRPVTLELPDGRRILATGVLPGGYVLPRRTDPPFAAADVRAVVPASPEDIAEERRRQAGQGGGPP